MCGHEVPANETTSAEPKIIFEHGWSFVQSMYILSSHHSILVGHRGVVAIIGVAFWALNRMSAVVSTCVRFCVGPTWPTIREAPFAGLESSPR